MKKRKKLKGKRKPSAAVPMTTAIVYRENKPTQLDRGQVALIRRLCAKDASEDEFALFMQIAKKSKLDPFKKEIYCIIWPTENGRSHEMVIITGIGGYRAMAARNYKDYDGSSDGKFEMSDETTPAGKKIPISCTVEVYAKGSSHPTVSTVYWEEYAPADLRAKRSDFWNRMPKNQLEKCAEAKGLRKRFPGLNNIFVDAELDQRRQDYTEGNRQVAVDGVAPSGKILDARAAGAVSPERAKAIEAFREQGRWCEKHQCPKMKCPADEHTKAENDEAYEAERRFTQRRMEATRAPESKEEPKKEQKPAAEKPPIDVKPEPAQPSADIWPKGEKKPPKEKAAPKPKSMEGMTLVQGTLHNTVGSTTKEKNTPVLNCKINGTWYKCYRTSIFEPLRAHHGFAVAVFVDPHSHNLVGLRRIGQIEFENDGKTEKGLDINREPGNGRK